MNRDTFVQRVSQRVLIGDGAMGTMLYQKGVFLNRCFDELNLTDGPTVASVHRSYVEAGSEFIETNTFGANQVKLSKFGLANVMSSGRVDDRGGRCGFRRASRIIPHNAAGFATAAIFTCRRGDGRRALRSIG